MTSPLTNATEVNVPTDGSDTDVWGLIVNAAFAAWDRHLGGVHAVTIAGSDVVLTAEEAQNGRIYITGSPTAAKRLSFPARDRTYLVTNALSTSWDVILSMDGFTDRLQLPVGCSMVVRTSTLLDKVLAASHPVSTLTGLFPPTITHDGQTFEGPGIAFTGGEMGFKDLGSGIMAVFLLASLEQASVRFDAANTAANPLIGMDADFNTGLYIPGADALGLVAGGAEALRLSTGVYYPGLSNPGAGKINMNQYFRSGVAMPIQKTVARTSLPLGANVGSGANHSQGSEPTHVFAKLRCTSADLGYASGDTISGPFASGNCAIMFGGNTTQLYYRQSGHVLDLPNKSTGTFGNADESKWRLELLGCWP